MKIMGSSLDPFVLSDPIILSALSMPKAMV